MNTELMNTIEGRASLVEMHARALCLMVPDRAFPWWRTKAERELDDAETALRNALRAVEQLRARIAASEREAA
jgi:hypothetical protein